MFCLLAWVFLSSLAAVVTETFLDAFAHLDFTSQLLCLFFLHCYESWTGHTVILAASFNVGLQANSVT